MKEELKPCPFCGGVPIYKEYNNNIWGRGKWWYLECDNDDCLDVFSAGYNTKKEAAKHWNTRHGESKGELSNT